jgi:hypothetical protein
MPREGLLGIACRAHNNVFFANDLAGADFATKSPLEFFSQLAFPIF